MFALGTKQIYQHIYLITVYSTVQYCVSICCVWTKSIPAKAYIYIVLYLKKKAIIS